MSLKSDQLEILFSVCSRLLQTNALACRERKHLLFYAAWNSLQDKICLQNSLWGSGQDPFRLKSMMQVAISKEWIVCIFPLTFVPDLPFRARFIV